MRHGAPARRGGLVLGLLLASAGWAEAGPVRDMVGRAVSVPERPARVISLAPSLTETIFALGAAERLIGVTRYCDFPDEARAKARVGGVADPNFEVILSLRPDLVLATTEGNRLEDVRALERLEIPVYVVRPLDFASVLDSIGRVGELLGRRDAARQLVAEMRRGAAAVAQALEGAARRRVLYVLWGRPLIVPGRDTLITDLIGRAGGDSVSAGEPLAYPRFSVEEAVARQPDLVVVAQHATASLAGGLRAWPQLGLLPAVREGRVYRIDGDLTHRPGPRILEGLRTLARLIHPGIVW